MAGPQYALLLCVTFLGGRPAIPVNLSMARPAGAAGAAGAAPWSRNATLRTRVTRISPVPPGAPAWPRTASRDRHDASSIEEVAAASRSDPDDPAPADNCHSRSDRKLHDRKPFVVESGMPKQDDKLSPQVELHPDAFRPSAFGYGFDRDDTAYNTYSLIEDPNGPDGDRRPLLLEEEEDGLLPASYESDVISVDAAPPTHLASHAHGRDHGGPIIVRGPPFNSVAIGFLIYLILLTVLQSSIFNITKKGLLGLAPALRDRERRDMEEVLQAERRVQTALDGVGVQAHLPSQPVLVAAVLDAEPGQGAVGGPRRARRTSHQRGRLHEGRRRGPTLPTLPRSR